MMFSCHYYNKSDGDWLASSLTYVEGLPRPRYQMYRCIFGRGRYGFVIHPKPLFFEAEQIHWRQLATKNAPLTAAVFDTLSAFNPDVTLEVLLLGCDDWFDSTFALAANLEKKTIRWQLNIMLIQR